jgi:ionotropic glutamate receptor
MISCNYGDSYLGVQLTSKTQSLNVSGYDLDVIKYIALNLNWEPSSWQLTCVDYDDLFAGVGNQTFLMGLGGIPITSDKMSQGFEFSLPSFTSGLKVITHSISNVNLWSFFLSFDGSLWGMILLTTIVTGVVTWIFEDQTITCKRDRRCINNFKEMIWQAFSCLFYTSEIRLQKFSARIIFLCFWFMILVLTATYTADVTTKLSSTVVKANIKSLEDASRANSAIATLTPYEDFLTKYNLLKLNVSVWGPESTQGIFAEFQNNTIEGFAMDAPAADKFKSQYPCICYEFTDPIVTFNYGFVYNSTVNRTFIRSVDLALFSFKESPDIQNYAKKYIYVAPIENDCVNTSNQLTLDQLAGLWIILALVCFTAIIWDRITEWLKKSKGKMIILSNKKREEEELELKQDILDSYLMITDYIHIPSNDIHLRIEEDIRKSLDSVENLIKNRFNDVEKKVVNYLTTNCKALGLTDVETGSNISDELEDVSELLPRENDKEKVE